MRHVIVALSFWSALAVPPSVDAQSSPSQAASNEILGLFASHDVVLFGEQHDARLNYEFRLELLRSPGFADVVQDIVIESGNSLYQDLLDEYVLELQDVPIQELRQVWRNTTMTSGVWDPPIYEAFVHAVREVNVLLSPGARIRLLAGDPPIDWSSVTTGAEYMPFLQQRDRTPFEVIEREVIQKGRKALVIYGGAHLVREERRPDNIVSLLDDKYPGKALVLIPWSTLYLPAAQFQELTGLREGPAIVRLENADWASLSGDQLFPYLGGEPVGTMMDAILFLGPGPDERLEIEPEVLNDAAYQDELRRRNEVLMSLRRRRR